MARFFAKVQNKMHYAVSHQTAAEIVYHRADSKQENMGRIVSAFLDLA